VQTCALPISRPRLTDVDSQAAVEYERELDVRRQRVRFGPAAAAGVDLADQCLEPAFRARREYVLAHPFATELDRRVVVGAYDRSGLRVEQRTDGDLQALAHAHQRGNGGIRLPVLQLRQVPLRDSARSGHLGQGAPLGDSCVAKPDSQAHRVGRRTSHALLLEAMKQQMPYRKQGLTERARSRDRVTPTTGGPVGRERMDTTNLVIIVAYLVAMAGAGIWGLRRARSADDFIVA